jgi:hypothetical protein
MKFSSLIYVLLLSILISTGTASAELVGWWKLDEGFRSTFADSSGYGHDGTIDPFNENKVKWELDGYKGSALQFLTSTAPFTLCDANLAPGTLDIAESTFSFWEKTPVDYQEWGPALVLIGEQIDTDLELNDEGVPFIFSEPDEDANGYPGDWSAASEVILNDNQWHHITVTCSATDQRMVYYLDGAMEATTDPNWNLSDPVLTVRIGGPRSSEERRMWRNYIGSIDEVAVFNHALTAEEVALMYRFGPMPTPKASNPNPGDGRTNVSPDVVLSWDIGTKGDKHDVYFGSDFNDVNEASTTDPRGVLVSESQDDTTFDPLGTDSLEYGKVYYWRVDEINDIETDSPWKGDLWSFTTANFIPVDDFESYNDIDNIIYDTWLDYYSNNTGMTVGYIESTSMEKDKIYTGKQSMPLIYDNDGLINEGTDLERSGTLYYSEAERQWDEALDWTTDQVESLTIWFRGNSAQVSSFTEEPGGIYKVKGIGEDIWDRSDQFHFAYKEHSGAVKIIARVDSIESESLDPFAKAGIMIRDTLDANARYAALLMTPENGIRYQYRNTINGTTDRNFDANVAVPYWVRYERTSGGLLRAYYSENGTDWTSLGLKQVTMANPYYIGLAVTSHDPLVECEAQFSNVSFPGTTVSDEWASQDIGLLTNDNEPMYVVLNNTAVIYHDDPNAATIDQWTEWNIPLQSFADKGINLTNINSLGIGLGDRDGTEPGGKGILYIDDIRLYRPPLSNDN